MAKVKSFEISGVDEIQKILEDIAPNHARNLVRATNHSIATKISKVAKQTVKEITGTLKKAIKSKRKRSHPDAPVSDVIITTGKSAKNDGFYWRFVEYGTSGKTAQKARPFIRPAVTTVKSDIFNIYREQFGKKLESLLSREARKMRKGSRK